MPCLNSLADGILILTSDNRIERCNPALARMLNLPARAPSSANCHEEVIHWEPGTAGMTLEKAESGGWPLTPHAHLYVEGDLAPEAAQPSLPVGITYAPLIGENGRLLNIIATVRDITRFRAGR